MPDITKLNFLLSSGKVIMLQPASSRPPPTIMAGIRGMSIYIGAPFSYPPNDTAKLKYLKSLFSEVYIISVRTALNGRLYARMENGEEILITRRYAKEVEDCFMEDEDDERI